MDTVVISGKKYNEIDLLKEKEEYIRLEAVDLCFALTYFIQDTSAVVRAAVARKKVGHDVLVAMKVGELGRQSLNIPMNQNI